MATEDEHLSQWYKALSSADSLQVMGLLAGRPSLLKVGWGDDASQFPWKEKPWKERTALHVGVRRGNAKLVEQVLTLCKGDISDYSRTVGQDGGNATSTISEGQRDPAAIDEARPNDIHFPDDSNDELEVDQQQAEWISSALKFVEDQRHPEVKDHTFLRSLLTAKDVEYNLDAIAIGALHGNRKIFLLLLYAMGECKLHNIKKEVLPALDVTEESHQDKIHRANLRDATKNVVDNFPSGPTSFRTLCLNEYKKHVDFNFLPWQEYLFHFLFSSACSAVDWREQCARELWTAVRSVPDRRFIIGENYEQLWRFLLQLHDGQGRTPLNVASDSLTVFERVVLQNDQGKREQEVVRAGLHARDGAGRTAIDRALATGNSSLSSRMLLWSNFPSVDTELEPLFSQRWRHSIPGVVYDWTSSQNAKDPSVWCLDRVSVTNGFNSSRGLHKGIPSVECSPLHTAILQKSIKCCFPNRQQEAARESSETELPSQEESKIWDWGETSEPELPSQTESTRLRELMLPWMKAWERKETLSSLKQDLAIWECWGLGVRFPWRWREGKRLVELDPVELAALVGDVESLESLPLGVYNSNFELNKLKRTPKRPWRAFHIAANAGNYEVLKLLIDAPLCDPTMKDLDGNTALHHVFNVMTIGMFQPHLLDYVDCEHVQSRFKSENPAKENREYSDGDDLSERRQCIKLLLQAGCDIFEANRKGQLPYPQGKLGKNSKFLMWWYEIQAKEFDSTQSRLGYAANAILITATLVATTSYVGPLQPPMGLAGDPPHIQEANLWVRIFIFCDTLAFYLAFGAIMVSLIPYLPRPQQQMKDEVQYTRIMVFMTAGMSISSIIYIFFAFVSSSIAVVSTNVGSRGGSLAITSACIGGLFLCCAFGLFCLKLLAFTFPENELLRRRDNLMNRLILGKTVYS